ncbi:MAG TPA: chloride channel protein [Gemmatimonadales bacterium]|nr:chloride channel protein [Gemmatimonadales bacterium]
MAEHPESLPIAPSFEPALAGAGVEGQPSDPRSRIVVLSALALLVAFAAAAAAEALVALIAFATNLFFHQRLSLHEASPAGHSLGVGVIAIPVIGGLVVGAMARFGSAAIRGHGIPEAMERVLHGESRISPRVTLLKPVSAAIAIGTGGPFGAEGPIIATGGALGSLLGQALHTTADERKILLASGAAAGMAAIFGTPVAAVLLAIELLLFEYRARSIVPVALAASAATAVRLALHGSAPVFPMAIIEQPTGTALTTYALLGALIGGIAVAITRTLYAVEDAFERLPVHWMWWPALGGLVVGIVGYFVPATLGVGYDNITAILGGAVAGGALAGLVVAKLVSWTVALGSGTSGGTLAPLFTIGGGIGALVGAGLTTLAPSLGVDPRVAALVGMAAIFAGASRALLTSVVFAFETTRQPMGLLPLLAGCTGAYLVSLLRMQSTIMTERLSRRGVPVGGDLSVDHLAHTRVSDCATMPAMTLAADQTLGEAREWLAERPEQRHQGFPVVDDAGELVGVLTLRDLGDRSVDPSLRLRELIRRPPVTIYEGDTARDAADRMVRERVGRLPVVSRDAPRVVLGVITRSDLLESHARRIEAAERAERSLSFSWSRRP